MQNGQLVAAHRSHQLYSVENFLESVRLVRPYFKESGGGSIVVISSGFANMPALNAVYGAAKVN